MKDLRALLIEDSEDDASLILLQLKRLGYRVDSRRVDSIPELAEAVREESWDVILTDYNLPAFNAHDVLKELRNLQVRTPAIVVSGAIGEELAVELMRQGAHDYVLKHHLARLGPVLDRELREAQERTRLALEKEESESKFRHLVDSNIIAVIHYAADGTVRDANQAFLSLAGYTGEDLRQGKIIWSRIAHKGFTGGSERIFFDDELTGKDGARIPVSVGAVNIHGTPSEGIAYILDNRERMRREAEQREAIRARDEFIAVASHELKTPLTSLKMQSQILSHILSKKDGVVERKQMERLLDVSVRQVDRLSRLVEDMIDISRLNTGHFEMRYEPLSVHEILDDVLQRFHLHHADAEISFHWEPHSSVHAFWDRHRVEQVIENLLSNALKYGERKPIELNVRMSDAERVLIEVRDQGAGIAPGDQDRIFGRFERATPATHVSGMGLGLYIARRILESHHGTISVRSELGKGSVFQVELPLRPGMSAEEGLHGAA